MTRTVSSDGMGSMVDDVSAVGDVVAGEAFHRGTIDVLLRVLDAERIVQVKRYVMATYGGAGHSRRRSSRRWAHDGKWQSS